MSRASSSTRVGRPAPAWMLAGWVLLPVVALGAVSFGASRAVAAPVEYLGLPWEGAFVQGIQKQERDRRSITADRLVLQHQQLQQRPTRDPNEALAREFLLARAYTLRHAERVAAAKAERDPAQRSALLAEAARDRREATAWYRGVIERAPQCYFAYLGRGNVAAASEPPDLAAAVADWRRAAQINTRYPDPLQNLALTFMGMQRWKDAEQALIRLIQLLPGEAEARMRLAIVRIEMGAIGPARRVLADLLRVDPDNPLLRELDARARMEGGDVAGAQAAFKALATQHPSNPSPVRLFLQCLELRQKAGEKITLDEQEWGLSRMLRFVRGDPEIEKKLLDELRAVERARSQPEGAAPPPGVEPGQPPTEAQIIQVLGGPNVQGRLAVLQAIEAGTRAPPPEIMRAVFRRLHRGTEPAAPARRLAWRIVGRWKNADGVGLMRVLQSDEPDRETRLAGLDALIQIGRTRPGAAGYVLLAIAPALDDPDPQIRAAVRLGILQLGSARIDLVEDPTAGERGSIRAFENWWRGPEGEEARIAALARLHDFPDVWFEDLLIDHLKSRSYPVVRAAYGAASRIAESLGVQPAADPEKTPRARFIRLRGAGGPEILAWLDARPRFPDLPLPRAEQAAYLQAIHAWAERLPRS